MRDFGGNKSRNVPGVAFSAANATTSALLISAGIQHNGSHDVLLLRDLYLLLPLSLSVRPLLFS